MSPKLRGGRTVSSGVWELGENWSHATSWQTQELHGFRFGLIYTCILHGFVMVFVSEMLMGSVDT